MPAQPLSPPPLPSPRRASKVPTDPLLAPLQEEKDFRNRFAGRAVVVTGGASGIGRAIAFGFAVAGARVVVMDHNPEKGNDTLALLREISPESEFLPVNLCDPAAVEGACRVFAGPRGADILVNNAAMLGRVAPMHELDRPTWEKVMQANLLAPFQLSQALAQNLIARKRPGSIVNLLAIQTELPVVNYSPYIVSKGGLDAMTLTFAVDLAAHGIRVNGIRVGCVLTEHYLDVLPPALQKQVDAGADYGALLDERTATLVNRMGRPAEIARIALFLASDDGAFLTGSIIRADGGRAISRKPEPLME